MKKLKLKEDEAGNKISEVKGIRASCKIMKTRYAKPFESVQVKIPYETGMNPYSGLVDMLESKKLLNKEGNSLVYTTADGTVIKQFRKAWEANTDGCLDIAMKEISSSLKRLSNDEAESLPSAVDDAAEVMAETKLTVDGHGDVHEVTEEKAK